MVKQTIVGAAILLVILVAPSVAFATTNPEQGSPPDKTTGPPPTVTSEPATTQPSTTETPPITASEPPVSTPPSQAQGQGQEQGVKIGKGGGITAIQGQGQIQGQTGGGGQLQAQAQSQSINILQNIIKKSGGSTIIRQGSATQQIIILPVYVTGLGFVAPSNCKLNSDGIHIQCEFQVVSSK